MAKRFARTSTLIIWHIRAFDWEFVKLPAMIFRRAVLWGTASAVFLAVAAGQATADVILYTASTDNSGGVDPISVPNENNPNLPSISAGVTLNPDPALLDGNTVGPLNGITYGPSAFGGNTGGTTGYVHVSYTIPTAGMYDLVWEVSNVIDRSRESALAIDNVDLDGMLLYGFESGIPAEFTSLGTTGTSGAILDLPATQGARFAFLDTTGNVAPIFDTVDGTAGSRLISSTFSADAGTVLTMDIAFLTNDGGPFHDYGIAALEQASVPEPAAFCEALAGGLILFAWRRRARQVSRSFRGSANSRR